MSLTATTPPSRDPGMDEEFPDPGRLSLRPISGLQVRPGGIGEVKAHNLTGITRGLRRLDEQSRSPQPNGRTPQMLVTYIPLDARGQAQNKAGPVRGLVLIAAAYRALRPKETVGARAQSYLNGRETLYSETVTPSKEQVFRIAMSRRNTQLLGLVVDDIAREWLYPKLKKLGRSPRWAGGITAPVDLLWDELAPFYAELGLELGDPFLSELAAELGGPVPSAS